MLAKVRCTAVTALAMVGACLLWSCGGNDDEDGKPTPQECPDNLATIQILAPKAGDTLKVGVPFTIKWCYSSTISLVQIKFTPDDGETWFDVTTTGGVSKPTNTFVWTPQANHVSTTCRIEIAEYNNRDATFVQSGMFVVAQ